MPAPAAERSAWWQSARRRRPHGRLVAAATVAVLLAVFATGSVGQTYASWSDTANSSIVTSKAGSIIAVQTAAPGIGATFNAGVTTKTDAVTVTNTGTVSASYTTSTLLTSAPSTLSNSIAVTLWSTANESGCSTPVSPVTGTWGAPALRLTGTLASLASVVICIRTAISNLSTQPSPSSLNAALTTTLTKSTWTSTASTAVPQAFSDAAPSAPARLGSATTTTTSTTISWAASSDDVAVTGYDVYRGGVKVGSTTGATTFTDTGLTASSAYSYTVVARDGAGHASAPSAALSVTTSAPAPPDTSAPSAPVLTRTGVTGTTASLSWTASSDNVGVTSYLVYRGTTLVGTVPATSPLGFTDRALTPGATYTYTVKAQDAAGNLSVASNAVTATLPVTTGPAAGCTTGPGTATIFTSAGDNSGTISATVNGVTRKLTVPDRKNITVTVTAEELATAQANNGLITVVITHHRPNQEDVVLGTGHASVGTDGTVSCV